MTASAPAITDVAPISLGELYDKLGRRDIFLLVMAMDEPRFEKAHIEGSISWDSLEANVDQIDVDCEIVVYCTGPDCVASKLRAARLVSLGFTNVRRFAGGLTEWTAAGLPIIQWATAV